MIVRGEHLAGNGSRRLDHQAADLATEIREHLRALACGCFARPYDNLLGGGDRLLRFVGLHAGGWSGEELRRRYREIALVPTAAAEAELAGHLQAPGRKAAYLVGALHGWARNLLSAWK